MAKIKITTTVTDLESVKGGEISNTFVISSDEFKTESEFLANYYEMVTEFNEMVAQQARGE